jgi:hypothetical protein
VNKAVTIWPNGQSLLAAKINTGFSEESLATLSIFLMVCGRSLER